MPIVQQGSFNATALVVPDVYVDVVPPQTLNLNGVPTGILGIVGTASWGPVAQPTILATMSDYLQGFGPVVARKHDAGTQMACAVQQGASNFRLVRVTDGTDTAASATLEALTVTGRYTGTLGNSLAIGLSAGTRAGTWKATVYPPSGQLEAFDNLPGDWPSIAAAINTGNGPLRPPSLYVYAFATETAAVTALAAVALVGGTDGAGVASSDVVGVDANRTGLFALRGQGCSVALLADLDDSTQWTTIDAFGLSEGVYMIQTGPSGDVIENAVAVKAAVGLDSYASKLMFGDWLYWNDQANGVIRLVSPQGFTAGRLANLSPEQSSLNKPLYSVVGSQKSGTPGSGQAATYSAAELGELLSMGIDVIANPQPGGPYWGVRGGHNSSSNPSVNGDNYTRLTNYLASTLSNGMGVYVGQLVNATLFQRIRATLLSFLQQLLGAGVLGSTDGSLPFSVVCDISNNPTGNTSLGYVRADCQVRYQAINEKFIVNLEGGQTTTVIQSTGQTINAATSG